MDASFGTLGTMPMDMLQSEGTDGASHDGWKGSIQDRYLLEIAQALYSDRRIRKKYIRGMIFGEPAWDMLLDLYINFRLDRRVGVTSLCFASGVPNTTALRYISVLIDLGFATRNKDSLDQRMTIIEITDMGVEAMSNYLSQSAYSWGMSRNRYRE